MILGGRERVGRCWRASDAVDPLVRLASSQRLGRLLHDIGDADASRRSASLGVVVADRVAELVQHEVSAVSAQRTVLALRRKMRPIGRINMNLDGPLGTVRDAQVAQVRLGIQARHVFRGR